MCGRCACSLDKDALSRACTYENAKGDRHEAAWVESYINFVPSVNIGPKDVVPCLVAGSFFKKNRDDQVLCPMLWSMIPSWHQGDYRHNRLSTHNARLETITDSKLYSPRLKCGERCIIVCEGYYEWKESIPARRKQPYYIYPTQENEITVNDPTTCKNELSMKSGGKGPKLMKMAGIFNSYFDLEKGKMIYSCSIITTEANSVLSWLHHRTPIFFNKEADERAWVNGNLSMMEAVDKLKALTLSEEDLKWYMVSTKVNDVKCKDEECRKEIKKGTGGQLTIPMMIQGITQMKKEEDEQIHIEKRKREDKEIESDCAKNESRPSELGESLMFDVILMQKETQENKRKKRP